MLISLENSYGRGDGVRGVRSLVGLVIAIARVACGSSAQGL